MQNIPPHIKYSIFNRSDSTYKPNNNNNKVSENALPYSAGNAPVEKSELLNILMLKIVIPPPDEPCRAK